MADAGAGHEQGDAWRHAMKLALQAYVDRTNAGDVAGLLELFAPDAVIEDPVGTPGKVGSEIAAWFTDSVAFGTRIIPVAPTRSSHGNEAALIFDAEFTPPLGERTRIRSVDVCRFSADGKIVSLRAFWGPDDIIAADATYHHPQDNEISS